MDPNQVDTSLLQYSIQTISPIGFIINIVLIIILSYILGLLYVRFGKSLSNRSALADSFPLLGLATMVIITVVKSSLALSLGLVGALSIVRFRTPIKEPEELIYLFLCITFGLAVGANQRLIASITLVVVGIVNLILKSSRLKSTSKSGSFSVFLNHNNDISQAKVIEVFKNECNLVILKRSSYDSSTGQSDLSLSVELSSYKTIEKVTDELDKLSKNIKIDIIDNSKVLNS